MEEAESAVLEEVLIAIPIAMMYILWLSTPSLDDLFLLRREIKLLMIYGFLCILIHSAIDGVLYGDGDGFEYEIELQLVLTLVDHMIVFGIFVVCPPVHAQKCMLCVSPQFLVWYPLRSMVEIYGDGMDGERGSVCWCLFSLRFLEGMALSDSKSMAMAMAMGPGPSMAGKAKLSLHSVATSSNRSHLGAQIAMTTVSKGKGGKYRFGGIAHRDGDEDDESTDNGLNGFRVHDLQIYNEEDEDETDYFEDLNYDDSSAQNTCINIGRDSMTMTPIAPHQIVRIKPTMDGMDGDDVMMEILRSGEGLRLFLRHCAREYSMENVLAMMELNQFQLFCQEQDRQIAVERERRKKTAKRRTARKKHSILKKKKLKKDEIRNKKQRLMESKVAVHKRRRNRKRRESKLEQDLMDEDDHILHETASRPPIDIAIAAAIEDEEDEDGDDGDDEDVMMMKTAENEYIYDLSKENVPRSSIVNRPFIVFSKNKRIEQMERIIIALSEKYFSSKSYFKLNLPIHIEHELEAKIERMRESHRLRRERARNRVALGDGDGDGDDAISDSDRPPETKLHLTSTESNASNAYPLHYEETLPLFFDHVIEIVVRLMTDSFIRFRATPEYTHFEDARKPSES